MGPVTNEMTKRMFDNAESSTAQTAEVVSSAEDVVLVEDASDDEDVSDAQVKVENPILLITIEDGSTHSMIEARVEEPRPMEDPPVAFSPAAIVTKAPCTPIHPSSPPITTARRQCKVYDRSSLRRSVHLAQRGVLKDLVIVGNDGKFNKNAIQEYAGCLQ
jgi:hypothetical protein